MSIETGAPMTNHSDEFEKRLSEAAYVFATETRVAFNHDMTKGTPTESALGIGFIAGAHHGIGAVIEWVRKECPYVQNGEALANEISKRFQSGQAMDGGNE